MNAQYNVTQMLRVTQITYRVKRCLSLAKVELDKSPLFSLQSQPFVKGGPMQDNQQLRYLLALLHIPGMGPVKLAEVLKYYTDLSEAFTPAGDCRIITGKADWGAVEKDLQWAEQPDCFILGHGDPRFPPLLKEIQGAPVLLFVRGDLKCLTKPQIAIVGSRNPTPQGKELAASFAKHFATLGLVVTSGLAIGVDGAAHKGALLGGGSTIAVLGNGLDTIYPSSHKALTEEIAAKGALLSEFPIGTPALPVHFPRRNRIISGLSMGTLVIEAALKSGSLVTAKFALEQGREVFAIPGSIHNAMAKGCHALIRQGAKLVETAEDVLEELGALLKYVTRPSDPKSAQLPLPELESKLDSVLSYVGYECTPIDLVVMRSGLTAAKVSSMLLELELMGHVVAVPGGYARLLSN
jgi:DNA processing protein